MTLTSEQLVFYSSEYKYQVGIDRVHGGFVIFRAFKTSAMHIELLREKSWEASVEFKYGHPVDEVSADSTKQYILTGLSEFKIEEQKKQHETLENTLFDKWRSLLKLQNDCEAEKETSIKYQEYDITGNRITLKNISRLLDDEYLEQPRLIKNRQQRSAIEGVIESYSEDSVTLYCEAFELNDLMPDGEVVFDSRRALATIKRQEVALDSVRFRRSVRTDLRNLLIRPQGATYSTNQPSLEFFQKDLDHDKKDALEATMSSDDFVVIEGPPGTGKTKFIAELVLQQLKVKENSRILLCSQTHNALDNALERIQLLLDGKPSNLVRIALKGDPRVSKKSEKLLLDNCVDGWLDSVKAKSEKYLIDWSIKHGIDKSQIDLALAIGKYRSMKEELRKGAEAFEQVQTAIDQCQDEETKLSKDPDPGEKIADIKLKLKGLERDSIELKTKLTELKRKEKSARGNLERFDDGKEFSTYSPDELKEWEEVFLTHSDKGEQLVLLCHIPKVSKSHHKFLFFIGIIDTRLAFFVSYSHLPLYFFKTHIPSG